MITVSGLTKQYGDRTVVDDVSFTLEPGTVTGFLGPNGAGKTTTMRMIDRPGAADGRARRWSTAGPTRRCPTRAPSSARCSTPSAVHPGRTGRTHLRLLADGHRRPGRRGWTRCSSWSACADAGRRRIGGYSLGMRQRLGIAGALLADPPVLMFDEPANGLDPEGIRWMRDLLRGHAARGGTVLLSSHLLGEVEHTVDRLLVIGGGRIVADGPVASLLGADGVAVRALTRRRWPRRCRPRGFPVERGDDGALVVAGADPAAGRRRRRRRRSRPDRPAPAAARPRGPLLPAHHRGTDRRDRPSP